MNEKYLKLKQKTIEKKGSKSKRKHWKLKEKQMKLAPCTFKL